MEFWKKSGEVQNQHTPTADEITRAVDLRLNADRHEHAKHKLEEEDEKRRILSEAEALIPVFIEQQRLLDYKDAELKRVYDSWKRSAPEMAVWHLGGDPNFRTWWLTADGRFATLHVGSGDGQLHPLEKFSVSPKPDSEWRFEGLSPYSMDELTLVRDALVVDDNEE